jgi:hypothetical protein
LRFAHCEEQLVQFPTLRSGFWRFAQTSGKRRLIAAAATVVVAAFAAAGCSPPHLYSASAGFSRTATISVHAAGTEATTAVNWWNSRAGRQLFVLTTGPAQVTIQTDNGSCGPISTERVACTEALPLSGRFADPPAYAYDSCEIFVSSAGAPYWEVFAHELGHCLGFDHVTDRESIMNPHPIASDVWDQSMLAAAGYR